MIKSEPEIIPDMFTGSAFYKGAKMKRSFFLLIFAVSLVSTPALADDFSLFGVSMGMPRAEVETHWQKSGNGDYQIPDSLIFNILPEFDHRDRLYRISFSMPIPLLDQYPGAYVTTAFQKVVQEQFGKGDQSLSIRTGRGTADITLTDKPLLDSFNEHIQAQMLMQLPTILKR